MSKYQMQGELGRGAMGIVYRARHEDLGREIAIKVLNPGTMTSEEMRRRFEREIRACIELSHPNIIKVLDYGDQDGQPYYVMELILDAVPLDRFIRSDGAIQRSRAARLMDQLLDALDYVHAHKFIHRDLKPANLMLRPGDHLILMDFGLVKPVERTVLTREGSLVGTPRYIAPEVLRGKASASASSDVFAAGAVLYELLTGKHAFDGRSLQEVLEAILVRSVAPPTSLRPGLPPETDPLIGRFLAKDPAGRFASAAEAREAVARWADLPADSAVFKVRQSTRGASGAHSAAGQPGGPPGKASRGGPAGPTSLPATASRSGAPSGAGAGEGGSDSTGAPAGAAHATLVLGGILLLAAGLAGWYGLHGRPSGRSSGASPGTVALDATAAPVPVASVVPDLDWGATAVTARWHSEREGKARLEVMPTRGDTAPPVPSAWAASLASSASPEGEGTPARDHVVWLSGLAADSEYLLIGRLDGVEVFRSPGRTITVAGAALRLGSALDKLDPWRWIRDLRADAILAEASPGKVLPPRVKAAVAHHNADLARAYERARLDEAVRGFEGVRDAYFSSLEMELRAKIALYRRLALLHQLEGLASLRGLALPALFARASSPFYGPESGPRLARPESITLTLEKWSEPLPEPPCAHNLALAEPHEKGRMSTYFDLREAPFEPQPESKDTGDIETPFLRPPNELPLPPAGSAGAAELHIRVEGARPSVILTIFLRADQRSPWNAIAQVNGPTGDRIDEFWHGLDPRLLGGTARMRIDLIRGDDRPRVEEQTAHILTVSFRWDPRPPEASPAPPAH